MTLGDFVNLMLEEKQKSYDAIAEIESALLTENAGKAFDLLQIYKKEHIHPRDLDRDVLKNCVRKGKNKGIIWD